MRCKPVDCLLKMAQRWPLWPQKGQKQAVLRVEDNDQAAMAQWLAHCPGIQVVLNSASLNEEGMPSAAGCMALQMGRPCIV